MKDLTPDQIKLIDNLLSGKTISETAEILKKSRMFIYENLEKPAVKAEYHRRLNDLKTDSENRISGLYQKAIDTLESSLDAENESVRLKTALFLLDRLDKMRHLESDAEVIEHEQKRFEDIKFI